MAYILTNIAVVIMFCAAIALIAYVVREYGVFYAKGLFNYIRHGNFYGVQAAKIDRMLRLMEVR